MVQGVVFPAESVFPMMNPLKDPLQGGGKKSLGLQTKGSFNLCPFCESCKFFGHQYNENETQVTQKK